MKGLLYRELLLVKKNISVSLLIFFLVAFCTDLIAVSARIGNIAKYCSSQTCATILRIIPLLAVFGFLIPIAASQEAALKGLESDFRTQWMKYALSSPKKAKELVGAKYLAYFIMVCCAFLLGMIHIAICCCLAGSGVSQGVGVFFFYDVFITMTVTFLMFLRIYYFQGRSMPKRIRCIILCSGAIFIIALNIFCLNMLLSEEKFMGLIKEIAENLSHKNGYIILNSLAVCIMFLLSVMSFFLTTRILQKQRLTSDMYSHAKPSAKKKNILTRKERYHDRIDP